MINDKVIIGNQKLSDSILSSHNVSYVNFAESKEKAQLVRATRIGLGRLFYCLTLIGGHHED